MSVRKERTRSRSKSASRKAASGFNLERSDEVANKIKALPNYLNKTWGLNINNDKWENLHQKLERQQRFFRYKRFKILQIIFRQDQRRHWPNDIPLTLVSKFVNFKRGDDKEKSFILHELDKLLEKAQKLEEHFGYRAVLISLIASLFFETGDYYQSEKYLTKFINFQEIHSRHTTYDSEILVCKFFAQFQCSEFSMDLIQLSNISAAYRDALRR